MGLGLALALGGAAAPACADLYRYVDERGGVHFTDAPTERRYARFELQARTTRYDGVPLASAFVRPRGAGKGFDPLIAQAARVHGLPTALVKAVIATESNFNPRAVSRKGAQGLMQLMPETSAALGVGDPFAPQENVQGGVRYLRELLDRFGTVSYALAAYNAGPSTVDRYGGIPPFPETQQYVARVLAYYRHYHEQLRQ
jgi:soluble lytic murein transglycosylase-like protein